MKNEKKIDWKIIRQVKSFTFLKKMPKILCKIKFILDSWLIFQRLSLSISSTFLFSDNSILKKNDHYEPFFMVIYVFWESHNKRRLTQRRQKKNLSHLLLFIALPYSALHTFIVFESLPSAILSLDPINWTFFGRDQTICHGHISFCDGEGRTMATKESINHPNWTESQNERKMEKKKTFFSSRKRMLGSKVMIA